MAQKSMFQNYRSRWVSTIGGILLATYPTIAIGQIAGDGTLGTQVNGALTAACTGNCIITNGATRGRNLFHSFRQFSLPNGDFAGFVTTPAIENVIVRVTGVGQPFISNINGTIATTNAAVTAINPTNFFLINPNGIIFGPNARLLIDNSFLATTASRMQFADGTEFRTADPSPLLTINVPSGLQFGQTPGNIQMQRARLIAGNRSSFGDFAIVGGNVTLDNSIVFSPGRRVELDGVAKGIVGLRVNGNNLSLDILDDVERADISLLNRSQVRVEGGGGGSIGINARNLNLSGGSLLVGGISQDLVSGNRQAGDITINATGTVTAETGSQIASQVFPGRTGNSGNIQIKARSLSFSTSALLLATTFGNGNAGNIIINAQEGVSFDGKSANGGFQSGIYNTVEETGTGKAGNIEININAGSLSLTRGAQLDSSVFGVGNGGNIIINASQSVVFDGVSPDGFQSSAFSEILKTGQGRGGGIQITADSLSVTNGALLSTGTRNKGDAGNITIDVRDRVLFNRGTARTTVGKGAIGNGGDIQITARSVEIASGGELLTFTSGEGKAGNVTIKAHDTVVADGQNSDGLFTGIAGNLTKTGNGQGGTISVSTGSLTLQNDATFQTATNGQGNAGAIVINARDTVLITGQGPNGNSGLLTLVGETAKGKGGSIQITANSIWLTDNGLLTSSTLGQGDAGKITLDARNTVLFDRGSAFSNTQSLKQGNANDINISTDSFLVTNQSILSTNTTGEGIAGNILISAKNAEFSTGGQLLTATSGSKNAGNITLNVIDRLMLSGKDTGLFANTKPGSSGNGGSIFIDPRTVIIQDGAKIAVDSQGSGIGGSIVLQAERVELRDRASITAATASAQGGNIDLTVNDLLVLRRNSSVSTNAGTAEAGGNGGNISINAPFVVGVLSEDSDITANAFTGNGGKVEITTQGIYGLQFQPQLTPFSDITASSKFGLNGTVTINSLNVDPSRGLTALPINLNDPSQRISQGCNPGSKSTTGKFTATGRGGIPQNPGEPLESRAVTTKWVSLPTNAPNPKDLAILNPNSPNSTVKTREPIVEAQHWVRQADGTVELVTDRPSAYPASLLNSSITCRSDSPKS
jgi:filamentous hemagglutinin family protein